MPTGIFPRRVNRHAVIQPLDQSYRIIPLTRGQNALVDSTSFESKLEAADAYDEAAKKFHREFASLNFPPSEDEL
jgi:hypothetical protein